MPAQPLAPEDRLVLLLARGRLAPEIEAEARALLARPLHWKAILARAEEHEVYPLLHRHLRDLDFPGMGPETRQRLDGLQRANALQVTLLAEELARALHALARERIPAMPFRGPALARSLFGDRTLRTAGDLDVLVPREAARRAIRALAAIGYRPEITAPFLDRLVLHTRYECPLLKPGPPLDTHLDLHWGVLLLPHWEREAMQDLWSHASPSTCLGGAPCHAPSPEWELLALCAHAATHRWQGLKWLADIHEVCATRPLDWSQVEATASRLGWGEILGISVTLCARLLGSPAPPALASRALPGWLAIFPAADANPARDMPACCCRAASPASATWPQPPSCRRPQKAGPFACPRRFASSTTRFARCASCGAWGHGSRHGAEGSGPAIQHARGLDTPAALPYTDSTRGMGDGRRSEGGGSWRPTTERRRENRGARRDGNSSRPRWPARSG